MDHSLVQRDCSDLSQADSQPHGVREFANKPAASTASPDYVKFQAVVKSAASAASLRGGRASGRLDHGPFSQFLAAPAAKKNRKKIMGKVAFSTLYIRIPIGRLSGAECLKLAAMKPRCQLVCLNNKIRYDQV